MAARAGPPNAAEMTSKEDSKAAPGEERRRSPLDHLPPPANSNKPLTPFSIEDILNKPSVRRSYSLCGAAHLLAAADKHAPGGLPLAGRALLSQTSPLCALEELASKTFKGLEVSVLQAAEGRRRHWVPPRPAPRDLFRVSHAYCPRCKNQNLGLQQNPRASEGSLQRAAGTTLHCAPAIPAPQAAASPREVGDERCISQDGPHSAHPALPPLLTCLPIPRGT